MRNAATDAEAKLWRLLRDRRLGGSKFRRQAPIGRYIVDFVCFDRRLIVEADGGQHAQNSADEVREAWFAAQGFRTMRYWNNDILTNPEGVLSDLVEKLALSCPPPDVKDVR